MGFAKGGSPSSGVKQVATTILVVPRSIPTVYVTFDVKYPDNTRHIITPMVGLVRCR